MSKVEVFPAFRDEDGDWYETPVVLYSAYQEELKLRLDLEAIVEKLAEVLKTNGGDFELKQDEALAEFAKWKEGK